jgi:hypothetical protein
LILDDEWSQWSDRQIARHIGVGNKLVSTVRRQLEAGGEIDKRDEVMAMRNGKAYVTKVSRPFDPDTREQRIILRLIDRLGSAEAVVEAVMSVSEHTSGGEYDPTNLRGYARENALATFAGQVQALCNTISFKVSSRGWCYILEEHGLRKGDFNRAERQSAR